MSYKFEHKEEMVGGKKYIRVNVELPPRQGAEPIKTCYSFNVVEYLTTELNLDFKKFIEGGQDLARNDKTPDERSQTWLAELHSKPSVKPAPTAQPQKPAQSKRRRRSTTKVTPKTPTNTRQS